MRLRGDNPSAVHGQYLSGDKGAVVGGEEERGAGHIQVFGGGGGPIVPDEIAELEAHGVAKIYAPEDGMRMGLEGIEELTPFGIRSFDFEGTKLVVSRTGYTGDLGYELWIEPERALVLGRIPDAAVGCRRHVVRKGAGRHGERFDPDVPGRVSRSARKREGHAQ